MTQISTSSDKNREIVLDLNGFTWTTGGRATGNGGNPFMEMSQFTMSGGAIEDGISGKRGG